MRILKGPYLQDARKHSMTIMWETDEATESIVRVYKMMHPHVPSEPLPVEGDGQLFSGECNSIHRVTVSGLEPGCDYVYEIVNAEGEALTGRAHFRTAPGEEAAFSFVLTAEHGGVGDPANPFAHSIIDLIGYEHPDFIQSVGDIVWNGTHQEEWSTYLFTPFAKLLSGTPFYPCIGNHEAGGLNVQDDELDRYVWFNQYFALPHYYSYDYGCAHFVVLDTPFMCRDTVAMNAKKECFEPRYKENLLNSEQIRFLREDLAGCDKKWKFVIFHYPPYTSATWDSRQLQALAPIFEQYGVDIVFNSHAIVYERSHPIVGGKAAPCGPRYILVGGYGRFDSWFWPKAAPHAAKLAGNRPNYVRVALSPYRLELQAIDYEGKLFDQMELEKV